MIREVEIKIILMNHQDDKFMGKNIKEIQDDYFENYLKNESYFDCKNRNLNILDGDMLLFQMDNQIIASAIYSLVDKCNIKKKTIKTFKPIEINELKEYIIDSPEEIKREYKVSNIKFYELTERMYRKYVG